MVAKTKTAKAAKKSTAKPARPSARKAPVKAAPKSPAKAPARAAAKGTAKAVPKSAAGPVTKAGGTLPRAKAAARPAPARTPAAKTAGKPSAAKSAAARQVAVSSAAPALRQAPAPKVAVPASAKEVAAAHEYLLSRSAHRSEEPVVVNGKRLPSEEQLLKMPDAAYMNDEQLAFFKYRLQRMERELLANAGETTEHLRETVIVPDPADRATIEEEHALELRTRDRERKLLKKVQSALQRIESGEYGYCEETGDLIGIPRLLARPTATLSL